MPVRDGHLFQIAQWLAFYLSLKSSSRMKHSSCLVVFRSLFLHCTATSRLPASNSSGRYFFHLFPHWVYVGGLNKEREMWFNGVHEFVFIAAKSEKHILFCPLLPPLLKSVILLKFSVSRAVSSGSWGPWCHRVFHSSFPTEAVCILLDLDSHGWHFLNPHSRPDASKLIGGWGSGIEGHSCL